MSEYAERNIRAQADVYCKHISAMTGEGLHSKSAIAAELAHRDINITQLQKENETMRGEIDRYKNGIKSLTRSATIVSHSLNSGDFVPEFRYKEFEKDIKSAKKLLQDNKDDT